MLAGWAGAAEQPADVEALMRLLGKVEAVDATWHETIESGLLATAISETGRLTYRAPDHITRISDRGEGFVLAGDSLTLIRGGEPVREVAVSEIEPLARFVETLRAIFSGDLDYLRSHWQTDYGVADGEWRLRLAPAGAGLALPFRSLEIGGRGATVRRIDVIESDGDERRMRMQLLSREPADLR